MRFQFDFKNAFDLLLYGFNGVHQHLLRFFLVNLRVIHCNPFAIWVNGVPVADGRNVCRA